MYFNSILKSAQRRNGAKAQRRNGKTAPISHSPPLSSVALAKEDSPHHSLSAAPLRPYTPTPLCPYAAIHRQISLFHMNNSPSEPKKLLKPIKFSYF